MIWLAAMKYVITLVKASLLHPHRAEVLLYHIGVCSLHQVPSKRRTVENYAECLLSARRPKPLHAPGRTVPSRRLAAVRALWGVSDSVPLTFRQSHLLSLTGEFRAYVQLHRYHIEEE
jgi:hypothetical protein